MYSIARQTDQILYNEIIQHPQNGKLVKLSSKHLHVYRNLKTIIQPMGTKGDVLRQIPFSRPAAVVLTDSNALDFSKTLLEQGYSPLTLCPMVNQQYHHQCQSGRCFPEDELAVRTSALYPLRSHKYRNVLHTFLCNKNTIQRHNNVRQCLSVFLPQVFLFRGDKDTSFVVWPWPECRFLNFLLVSGTRTLKHVPSVNDHFNVIKAKLNCLFDVALQQRQRQAGYLDSVVFTDLYCETVNHQEAYVEALCQLIKSYKHHFRLIAVTIDRNPALLEKLRCRLSLTNPHNVWLNGLASSEQFEETHPTPDLLAGILHEEDAPLEYVDKHSLDVCQNVSEPLRQ